MKHNKSRRKFLTDSVKGLGAAALGSQLYPVVSAQSKDAHSRAPAKIAEPRIRFVIHGGAGTILRNQMTPEREKAYRTALTEALMTGYDILKKGRPGLDAVE